MRPDLKDVYSDYALILLAIRRTFFRAFALVLVVLLLNVFVAALGVVILKNNYRTAYIQYEKMTQEQDQLHTQWMKLLIEKGTWANNARIEDIAVNQMDMVLPKRADSHILIIPPDKETSGK